MSEVKKEVKIKIDTQSTFIGIGVTAFSMVALFPIADTANSMLVTSFNFAAENPSASRLACLGLAACLSLFYGAMASRGIASMNPDNVEIIEKPVKEKKWGRKEQKPAGQ